jgi:hypothetical protein
MGEAERLQFMAELLESVTEAPCDLNDGLHCFAEGLFQTLITLEEQASTVRHFRPAITLADRVHHFDQTIRDQQHAIRRSWRRKKSPLRFW